MSIDQWRHKDEWRREGKDFMVAVEHFPHEPSSMNCADGGHRWTVSAYIYPKHSAFAGFVEGDGIFQQATNELPLHCGASLLRFPRNKDGVTSVHVAADYTHLYDDHYTHMVTQDDAHAVFNDAERLFDHLQARTPTQPE